MKNYLNKILISFFAVFALGFSQDNYALDIASNGHVNIGNLSNYINNGQEFSVSFWFKVNSLRLKTSSGVMCLKSGLG